LEGRSQSCEKRGAEGEEWCCGCVWELFRERLSIPLTLLDPFKVCDRDLDCERIWPGLAWDFAWLMAPVSSRSTEPLNHALISPHPQRGRYSATDAMVNYCTPFWNPNLMDNAIHLPSRRRDVQFQMIGGEKRCGDYAEEHRIIT
jgi:hypothetical protein